MIKDKKNMRNYIKISINLLFLILISGCKDSGSLKHFCPIDGTKALYIEYKDDSIKIYKETYQNQNKQLIYRLYKKGDNYYTDTFGGEELFMSNSIFGEYSYHSFPKRDHNIRIRKENDSLFLTSVYIKVINTYLDICLEYDNEYNIISAQNWDVYKTFSDVSNKELATKLFDLSLKQRPRVCGNGL